jgi:amidase
MARTVADVALMLQAIVGPDARAPLSFGASGALFAQSLEAETCGLRVAWSADLGGRLPLDPRTRAAFEARRGTFEDLGCVVEPAAPDFSDADEIFQVLRAFSFELGKGALLDSHREQMKDTVIWNIEQGRLLSGPQVGRAMRLHAELYERVRTFMQRYDFLVLPVSQVPPFPIEQPYVTEIDGVKMGNYIEWMRSCYYITLTGLPAIAVPAGFTPEGLPVGLQIVGRYCDELSVLRLAQAYEQATQFWRQRPGLTPAGAP